MIYIYIYIHKIQVRLSVCVYILIAFAKGICRVGRIVLHTVYTLMLFFLTIFVILQEHLHLFYSFIYVSGIYSPIYI